VHACGGALTMIVNSNNQINALKKSIEHVILRQNLNKWGCGGKRKED
jgi:hypothetical protein